jgi:hypothetical protein
VTQTTTEAAERGLRIERQMQKVRDDVEWLGTLVTDMAAVKRADAGRTIAAADTLHEILERIKRLETAARNDNTCPNCHEATRARVRVKNHDANTLTNLSLNSTDQQKKIIPGSLSLDNDPVFKTKKNSSLEFKYIISRAHTRARMRARARDHARPHTRDNVESGSQPHHPASMALDQEKLRAESGSQPHHPASMALDQEKLRMANELSAHFIAKTGLVARISGYGAGEENLTALSALLEICGNDLEWAKRTLIAAFNMAVKGGYRVAGPKSCTGFFTKAAVSERADDRNEQGKRVLSL